MDYCPDNCSICKKQNLVCYYEQKEVCRHCGNKYDHNEFYEYKGAVACINCIDKIRDKVETEEKHESEFWDAATSKYKGIDIYSDSKIAEENRKIFKIDPKKNIRVGTFRESLLLKNLGGNDE